ncbi:MAG: YbbR-like domain-containing protein, partial [Acidobacteriota bacterium]|nr:YbbR-like domain-containing protein [Acidobacteriota bacterium]
VERQIDIKPNVEGNVAEGYEVYSAVFTPARIKVRGPASIVNGIMQASTESISLDGKKSSFDLNQVAVDVPDQKVDILDGLVQVHVEIGERAVEKTFSDVAVQSTDGSKLRPQVAELIVSAPPWVFSQLRSDQIRLVVDFTTGRENGFSLELPPSLQGKVKIKSVKPTRFMSAGK